MLAVKIFSDDPIPLALEALSLVEQFPRDCGLEIGMYSGEQFRDDICERIRAIASSAKILHIFHGRCGLSELSSGDLDAEKWFQQEVLFGANLEISACVIHGCTKHHEFAALLGQPREAARNWAKGAAKAAKAGLRPHYEKTFEPLFWFIDFFDEWDRMGLARESGFCLDIGHVRIWGNETLDTWLKFTRQLQNRGFSINFHLHANDATSDQHTPLSKAYSDGLLEPTADWAPRGLMAWLKDATKAHPESLFTLESATCHALEAFHFSRWALGIG